MRTLALTFAFRLPLGFALTWVAWRFMGAIGLLLGGVVLAFALARPLLDLAAELQYALRARLWREVEGRHHAFRGRPVQVLEDVSHCRWVRADDVRAVVGFTASDGALALSYPNGYRRFGEAAQWHFSDEALMVHLAKESSPAAIRLRRWVQREINFPARRVRARLGIRLDAPEAPATD